MTGRRSASLSRRKPLWRRRVPAVEEADAMGRAEAAGDADAEPGDPRAQTEAEGTATEAAMTRPSRARTG